MLQFTNCLLCSLLLLLLLLVMFLQFTVVQMLCFCSSNMVFTMVVLRRPGSSCC